MNQNFKAQFKPINNKYRKIINRLLDWNYKYDNRINYLSEKGLDDSTDRLCDQSYEKAWYFYDQLPFRERVNLQRKFSKFYGYNLGY